VRAVERAGADAELTSDATVAVEADGLLVPGVGAFEACMRGLEGVDGVRIIERRLIASRPVLGICVGMQILFAEGIEHGVRTTGCGEWPGVVERLQAPIVPHMGWNTVEPGEGSRMFVGIEDERFYFVHSYGLREWVLRQPALAPPAVTWTEYAGDRFVSAAEHGPLWATQFHPEKSGDAGSQLLRNWLGTL
jgi:glutamine amidotransferase